MKSEWGHPVATHLSDEGDSTSLLLMRRILRINASPCGRLFCKERHVECLDNYLARGACMLQHGFASVVKLHC
eukprot:5595872-Pleurochrysis_carterae.AAC.1